MHNAARQRTAHMAQGQGKSTTQASFFAADLSRRIDIIKAAEHHIKDRVTAGNQSLELIPTAYPRRFAIQCEIPEMVGAKGPTSPTAEKRQPTIRSQEQSVAPRVRHHSSTTGVVALALFRGPASSTGGSVHECRA